MRNKFLETEKPGYHPIRKMLVIWNGLRYAVLHDISVAYKAILLIIVMLISLYFRQWVDLMAVLIFTGQMLVYELFNSTIEVLCESLLLQRNHPPNALPFFSDIIIGSH